MKKNILNSMRFAVIATDVVCFRIIAGRLNVLIAKVAHSDFKGKWALIGCLVDPKETTDQSAERVLKDKAGISEIYKEQLYTFSRVDRDRRGRVVSVAYMALAGEDPQTAATSLETRWCPVDALPELAYDHGEIIEYAVERLQGKIAYTNIAQYLLPEEFTFSELQQVYEVVQGREYDKRNFRKKVMAVGMLKDTKRTRKQGVMRPASLYKFASKKQEIVPLM